MERKLGEKRNEHHREREENKKVGKLQIKKKEKWMYCTCRYIGNSGRGLTPILLF